jgi:hypothetical protein
MPNVGDECWYHAACRDMKTVMDDDDSPVLAELDDPKWADQKGKPTKVAFDEMYLVTKGMPAKGTIKKVREDGTIDIEIPHPGDPKNSWIRRRVSWGTPSPATEKLMMGDGTWRDVYTGYATDPQ